MPSAPEGRLWRRVVAHGHRQAPLAEPCGLVHQQRPHPQIDRQPGRGVRHHQPAADIQARARLGVPAVVPQSHLDARRQRQPARGKREVVLRLLRGEDLESVSRELGITAARASQWREQFLAAGQAGLKSRAPDARDEANRRLQAKVGELLMENELLYVKVDQLEAGGPLARRRSTR